MIRKFIFSLLMVSASSVSAQQYTTKSNEDSSIVITSDSRLDDLVKKQKELNQQKQTIPGYRIQIYFGSNRPKANELKQDFLNRHPEAAAYLTYQQPNFKVRVGDFRTRLEAQKFLKNIEGQYATSFVVQDEIRIPALK